MIQTTKSEKNGFGNLHIAPKIISILDDLNYINPTPIQNQAIPLALRGKDIIGIAQTGTGKTLAFGLPMLQRLAHEKGQGLILLPTRELALQVDEVLQKIGGRLGLKTAVLIGGAPMGRQINSISKKPHIVIATPGRLADHMKQKTISLQDIRILVLDEADRMFDIGFAPQIKKIIEAVPKKRQTMLFSATMPKAIIDMVGQHLQTPKRIEVAPQGTPADKIEQEMYIASAEIKMQLLEKVLYENSGSVLLFSRTKHGARKITRAVQGMGHTAAEIHSNRSLGQRKAALSGFKSGAYRVLVATDIAARGIDVIGIALVINYDLPDQLENYVHRIGRTGRAEKEGKAISFACPNQRSDIKQIERLIRKNLTILDLPILPPKRTAPPKANYSKNFGAFKSGNKFHQKNFRHKRFQKTAY